MHSQLSVPIDQKFRNLAIGFGVTQLELTAVLDLSRSSLSRLKASKLRAISITGVIRILSVDSDILKFLFSTPPFISASKMYVPSEQVKLDIHRILGEISQGASDE